MLGRLNHVGVATPSIEASTELYRGLFGAEVGPARELVDQGVRVAFVSFANSEIELIEPLGPGSPLSAFLERNPKGGQHHVCFEVEDLIAARDALVAKGAVLIGSGEPRIGAHGAPVLFLHPKGTGGVLVELMSVHPSRP
jgi:methylmalonyl-CoA/ethylmalonyl-CoA epimerase